MISLKLGIYTKYPLNIFIRMIDAKMKNTQNPRHSRQPNNSFRNRPSPKYLPITGTLENGNFCAKKIINLPIMA
jgi:hypothetical protein